MNDYHTSIYFLILIFCLLISKVVEQQTKHTLYFLFCFLTYYSSISLFFYDIKYDYSGCQNIIIYLKEHLKPGEVILNSYTDATILPFFEENEIKMFSLTAEDYFFYDDFQIKKSTLEKEEFMKMAKESNAQYFIFYKRINNQNEEYIAQLEKTGNLKLLVDDSRSKRFSYKLYKYNK